jgi:hypothetical protein
MLYLGIIFRRDLIRRDLRDDAGRAEGQDGRGKVWCGDKTAKGLKVE